MSAPWTEAHRREALRWLCAELGALEGAHMPITIRKRDIASEMGFCRAIVREIDIDGQEIAVRRVRALAEGRLVRETIRCVVWPDGIRREHSLGVAVPKGWPVLRVTRIRRAS